MEKINDFFTNIKFYFHAWNTFCSYVRRQGRKAMVKIKTVKQKLFIMKMRKPSFTVMFLDFCDDDHILGWIIPYIKIYAIMNP